MSTKNPKNEVRKALQAMVDSAVADRMKAMPKTAPVRNAAPLTAKQALGNQIIKGYIGVAKNDPVAGDFVRKAMTSGGIGSGAELAPVAFDPNVVQAFVEKSAMARIALNLYENYSSKLEIPKLGKGTVRWTGEGADADTDDDISSGSITLEAFSAVARTKVSGALIRQPGSTAPESIGEALIRSLGEDADRKLFQGTGANGQPSGLYSLLAAAHKVAASVTAPATKSTAAEVEADILNAIAKVRSNNELTENAYFVMPPQEALFLAGLRDAVGNRVYPEMSVKNPYLHGFPVIVTMNAVGCTFVEGSGLHLGLPFASGLQVMQLGDDAPSDRVTVFARASVDVDVSHDKVGFQITGTATAWLP